MDQGTSVNNSSGPLHLLRQPGSLPSEILVEILLLSLPPLSECQEPQLKALSLVCRFWHLVVDSTPALWSQISIKDNIPHVREALSKSGEHPIDVCGESLIPAADWWGGGDEPSSAMFIAKVQQHAQRWRHATLGVPPPEESTPTFTILPWLQTLDLCSWDYFHLSDQLLALLNRQHVPFLRELSVRGLRIARWDLISLPPTLSKLEISRIKEDHSFIVRWVSIIAACPNLAIFRVCNTSMSPSDDVKGDEDTAPAIVELNALRQLDLEHVHPNLVIDLLMRLRLPEDCAISIKCRLQSPNPSTSFLSPVLSSQRDFQRAGQILQGTVSLTASLQDVLVVYQRWHIYLNLPSALATRNALDWFCNRGEDSNASSSHPGSLQASLAMFNSPSITFKLGRNWLHCSFSKLRAVSDLRNITRIEMDSLSDLERQAFLFYLSAPQDPNQPTKTMADYLQPLEPESNHQFAGVWPFPGLSELVRRESKDNVVHRVLVEPITELCSDSAAVGMSRRATRSEIREPNTPWEKVV